MLVLRPKDRQVIRLTDTVTGMVVDITPMRRDCGNMVLGFDAEKRIQIIRIKSKDYENEKR